jgi:hypothetical protein
MVLGVFLILPRLMTGVVETVILRWTLAGKCLEKEGNIDLDIDPQQYNGASL